MNKYLAIFTGTADSDAGVAFRNLSEEERTEKVQAGMQAWSEWMMSNHAHVIDNGGPLGVTKLVNREGISDSHNTMSAYVIIEAENHAAAAQLFAEHPHFMIFPGDGVEVMEIVAMPG
jgi:hypothetical protein